MKMAPVFICSRRKDKNIVDVGDTEGEITEDIIHHPLEGGPSVSEAEAGVVKCVCTKGMVMAVFGISTGFMGTCY